MAGIKRTGTVALDKIPTKRTSVLKIIIAMIILCDPLQSILLILLRCFKINFTDSEQVNLKNDHYKLVFVTGV